MAAGDKLFVCGRDPDRVTEYALSTPFDLTSASFTQNFAIASANATGIAFKPDGTKMYVSELGASKVFEYTLSTPWNIGTASFVQTYTSSKESDISGIDFKPDGSKMYLSGRASDGVHEYNLSTPWDISTSSFLQTLSTGGRIFETWAIRFGDDGSKLYISEFVGGPALFQYDLTTPWDISTASFVQEVAIPPVTSGGIWWNSDGTVLFLSDEGNDGVYKYTLSTPWDISTATQAQSLATGSQQTSPSGVFLVPQTAISETLTDDVGLTETVTGDVFNIFSDTLSETLTLGETVDGVSISGDSIAAAVGTCDQSVLPYSESSELELPSFNDVGISENKLNTLHLPPDLFIEIGEFQGLEPIAPTILTPEHEFIYETFSQTIQATLDGFISDLVAYERDEGDEAREWGKIKDDTIQANSQAITRAMEQEAARNFPQISGRTAKKISELDLALRQELDSAHEKFYAEQLQKALEVNQRGMAAGNRATAIVVNAHNQQKALELDFARKMVEVHFRVFEMQAQIFNEELRAKNIKLQAWRDELRGQILELQAINQNIVGAQLSQEDAQIRRELLVSAMEYLAAKQSLGELTFDKLQLEAEEERNKVLRFQAEVDKFESLLNLNIATYNLYKGQVDLEGAKIDKYRQRVRTADAKIGAKRAKTRGNEIEADGKISVARSLLDNQTENLRVAEQKLRNQLLNADARVNQFSSDLTIFKSQLDRWTRDTIADTNLRATEDQTVRDSAITLIRNLSGLEVETSQLDREAQTLRDLAVLDSAVIKESATVAASTKLSSSLIHNLVRGSV